MIKRMGRAAGLRGWTLCGWMLAAGAIAGCDGPEGMDPDAGQPTAFDEQVARGASLFGMHCAHCHGADGRGGINEAPPLVGLDEGALPLEPRPGAVRDTRFVTVGDIAAFAAVNMPADAPGTLEVDEYYAVLAFALFANGIELEEELTPALAEELVIPR